MCIVASECVVDVEGEVGVCRRRFHGIHNHIEYVDRLPSKRRCDSTWRVGWVIGAIVPSTIVHPIDVHDLGVDIARRANVSLSPQAVG